MKHTERFSRKGLKSNVHTLLKFCTLLPFEDLLKSKSQVNRSHWIVPNTQVLELNHHLQENFISIN